MWKTVGATFGSAENRRRMVRFNGKILPDEKVSPPPIAMGGDLEGLEKARAIRMFIRCLIAILNENSRG